MIRPIIWRRASFIAVAMVSIVSCQGCPEDPGGFLSHDFGTLNPLFDRASFEGAPGRVVDPDSSIPKRFRLEFILPVEPASIAFTSITAAAVVEGQPPFAELPTAAPDFLTDNPDVIPPPPGDPLPPPPGDPLPPPFPTTSIDIETLDFELSDGGDAVALVATLDAAQLQLAAGRDLIIQVDPSDWVVRAATTDQVFNSPMRFVFRVSDAGPDNDPPFLADIVGFASSPLDEILLGRRLDRGLTIVPPHAPLRFVFSEPMAFAAPIILPQDPVGFRPQVDTREGAGFIDLVTSSDAGFVPGQDYCVSFLPPRIANLGPVPWGTQDLSGEALVPGYSHVSMRRAARRLVNSTEFCFQAGPVRIEEPRPRTRIAGASGEPLFMEFLASPDCDGEPCDGVSYVVRARLDDGSEELGTDWVEIDAFEEGDGRIETIPLNGIRQGEITVPIIGNRVPIGGPGPGGIVIDGLTGMCELSPQLCGVLVRVDRCLFNVCTLGDIVPWLVDFTAPPDLDPTSLRVEDTDTIDGTVDRICVELRDPERDEFLTVDIAIGADGCSETTEVRLSTLDAEITRLGSDADGPIERRCWSGVEVPGHGELCGPGASVTGVTARRRDSFGNESNANPSSPAPTSPIRCDAPPRKRIVRASGRISAFDTDLSGNPHVVYAQGARLMHSVWDAGTDAWRRDVVACLCGTEAQAQQNTCPTDCDRTRWGWTVDLEFNAEQEPVVCYTNGGAPEDEPPGWEISTRGTVHMAVRADGIWERTTLTTRPGRPRALNMGCTLGTRPDRSDDPTVADYLLGFSTTDGESAALDLRYYRDTQMGISGVDRTLQPLAHPDLVAVLAQLASRPATRAGGRRDIAHDDAGRFWVAATGLSPHGLVAFGEVIREDGRAGFEVAPDGDVANRIQIGSSQAVSTAANPRIDARGDGEVAIAWTVRLNNKIWMVHRQPGDDGVQMPSAPPLFASIPSYDPGGLGEAPSSQVVNNGGVASTDHWFDGVPLDLEFVPGDLIPWLTWAAERPNGHDYHAIIVARPVQAGLSLYELDAVEARVEGAGALHLDVGPTRKARVVFHNGLMAEANTGSGLLAYYREEDGDSISNPRPSTQPRCFDSSLLVQDSEDRRTAYEGLDNAFASGVPRPALDPNPCGRTTDPGLTEELAGRLPELLRPPPRPGAPPSPPFFPSFRPRTRFNVTLADSEHPTLSKAEATAERTNVYRRDTFIALRQALGDLSFLDSIFPRQDGRGWNTVSASDLLILDPTATSEELFDTLSRVGDDSSTNNAGSLDMVLLSMDELFDDFCGEDTLSSCFESSSSVSRYRGCPNAGFFRRNPNGFYPGLAYDQSVNATLDLSHDPWGQSGLDAFTASARPGITSDDISPARETLVGEGEEPGLFALALRGLSIDEGGTSRMSSRVCEPIQQSECMGVSYQDFTGAPDFVIPLADAGDEDRSYSQEGVCPAVRVGARVQTKHDLQDGSPSATVLLNILSPNPLLRATNASAPRNGCCSGYEGMSCTGDGDCYILDRVVAGVTFGSEEFVRIPGRCLSGVCGGALDEPDDLCTLDDSCVFTQQCFPESCNFTEPVYCDDRIGELSPDTLEQIASDLCSPADVNCIRLLESLEGGSLGVLDPFIDGHIINSATAMLRAGACGPGSHCVDQEDARRSGPAPVLRPLLDHYVVRAITTGLLLAGSGSISDQLNGIARAFDFDRRDFQGIRMSRETVEQVRIEWIEHHDGALRLQGYLQVSIRMEDPALHFERGPGIVQQADISESELRVRLQPYYFADVPPTGTCDSCNRRRPDLTVRWRVASAGLFRLGSDELPVISSCSRCNERTINCALRRDCLASTLDGITDDLRIPKFDELDDLPAGINNVITDVLRGFEGGVDGVYYLTMNDPLVGGMLAGRLEAVDAITDFPICLADGEVSGVFDGAPDLAVTEANCGATVDGSHDRIRRANTIEAVRIGRRGFADVLARNNPP